MLTRVTRLIAVAAAAFVLTTPAALAIDSDTPDVSLDDARAEIRAGDFRDAVAILRDVISDDPSNADAHNLMGYSLRKSGDHDRALGFYLKAIKLNPRLKSAHEYLGELYVEIGQIEKAKEHLKIIAQLCGSTSCEEYEDLQEAIASL
jgi:Flp pilus assembly protein TadD